MASSFGASGRRRRIDQVREKSVMQIPSD
jgi:hypothetical protein